MALKASAVINLEEIRFHFFRSESGTSLGILGESNHQTSLCVYTNPQKISRYWSITMVITFSRMVTPATHCGRSRESLFECAGLRQN